MADMRKAVDRARSAASVAINRNRRIANRETDPDLLMFEQMGEQDFDKITALYGEEATLRYIKTMESRKMNKRG